jgi:hypothetical protein
MSLPTCFTGGPRDLTAPNGRPSFEWLASRPALMHDIAAR